MRILVTGAQGCIGAWVVKALLERGLDVLIYDTDPAPRRLALIAPPEMVARAAIATGRIEDTGRVKSLVRDGGITHIVHLAAVLMPFCRQHPVDGAAVNVIGTLNLFEAARDAGRPVRVVYASSSAVWGPDEAYGGATVSDSDPLLPATHYGVFKQANEGNARVFFHTEGISSVGLRPWAVYGVGRDRGLTADPTLAIQAVALGRSYQIRLSGYMDLQYVEDVAEAFVRCLLTGVPGAFVFNLRGTVVSLADFIHLLEQLRPAAAGRITAHGPQVPVCYRMDDSALRAYVPGLPSTPLERGVANTLEIFEKLGDQSVL